MTKLWQEVAVDNFCDGSIRETLTQDQWGSVFDPLKLKYETTNATCGYFAVACAQIISLSNIPYEITEKDLNEELKRLFSKREPMYEQVENAMSFVYEKRKSYIEVHLDQFSDDNQRRNYLELPVANFEISDYIKFIGHENIHFIRHIQTQPELLQYEESERVVEETPFRGVVDFFIEQPTEENGRTVLLKPKEWLLRNKTLENPPIFVMDIEEHSAVGLCVMLKKDESDDDPKETLLLLNSINGGYIERPILRKLFNLCFKRFWKMQK
jgi:hypothetical protein